MSEGVTCHISHLRVHQKAKGGACAVGREAKLFTISPSHPSIILDFGRATRGLSFDFHRTENDGQREESEWKENE